MEKIAFVSVDELMEDYENIFVSVLETIPDPDTVKIGLVNELAKEISSGNDLDQFVSKIWDAMSERLHYTKSEKYTTEDIEKIVNAFFDRYDRLESAVAAQ